MYTVVDKCNWKTKQCRNRRACYAGNCVAETQATTQLSLSRFPWITPTQWLGRFLGINRSVKILVFFFQVQPSTYMLQSSVFSLLSLRYILEVPLKWWGILLKSQASTGCSSDSTSSSVTSGRFSLFIACTWGCIGITLIFPMRDFELSEWD